MCVNLRVKVVISAHRLPSDNQHDIEQQTLLKSISSHREQIPVSEQHATDQSDPWQVVTRPVFTPHSRLLISTAFTVVSRVGCLGVTDVIYIFTKSCAFPVICLFILTINYLNQL